MVFNNPIPCHRGGGGGEACPEARIETTIKPITQHLDGKTIKASNKWWLKLNRLLGASEKKYTKAKQRNLEQMYRDTFCFQRSGWETEYAYHTYLPLSISFDFIHSLIEDLWPSLRYVVFNAISIRFNLFSNQISIKDIQLKITLSRGLRFSHTQCIFHDWAYRFGLVSIRMRQAHERGGVR